jgi:membrane protein required for colicin V production
MEITDIILIAIIGIFAIRGLIKGLVHEIFGIISIIVAFVAAYKYSAVVGSMFKTFDLSERSLNALGFVIVFIIAYLVVMIIAVFLEKILVKVSLSEVNRGGGMVFGAFKAAVILSVILASTVSFMNKDSGFVKTMKNGKVSSFLLGLSPVIYDVVDKFGDSNINPFKDEKIELKPIEIFSEDSGQKVLEKVKDSANSVKESIVDTADDIYKKIDNMTREEKDALAEKLLAPSEE